MNDQAGYSNQAMRIGCTEIVGLIETVFEPAALAIFEQQASVRALRDLMTQLAATVGPEGQARLERAMLTADQHLAGVAGQFGFLEKVSKNLRRTARQIRKLTSQQKRNMIMANMVATNARVVSSGIKTKGEMLTGFAIDVKLIITAAQKEAETVAKNLQTAETGLGRVSSGIMEMTRTGRALSENRARLPHVLESLRAFPDLLRVIERTQALCRKLDEALQGAVVHFQCGDSVRQRLEHVIAILDRKEAGWGPDGQVLQALARAQMISAIDDLHMAVSIAGPNLEAIETAAAEVHNEFLRLTSLSQTDILIDVSQMARRTMSGLERLDEIRAELEPAMNWLADAYGAAAKSAEHIGDLQNRMHLLGINAMLASNKVGSEGKAMTQVALHLRDCTAAIGTHSNAIVQAAQLQELDAILFAAPTAKAADPENQQQLAAVVQDCEDFLAKAAQLDRAEREGGLKVLGDVRGGLARLQKRLEAVRPRNGTMAVLDPSEELHTALDTIRGIYTMQGERDLHDRLIGRSPAVSQHDEPETAHGADGGDDGSLDDIFF